MRVLIFLLAIMLTCGSAFAITTATGPVTDIHGRNADGGKVKIETGTSAYELIQLDATSKLPAVDGSNLTGIAGGTPEGTAVLSTGEVGGTKFLREDGDGTSSWQAAAGSGDMVLDTIQVVTAKKTFGAAGDVGNLAVAGTTSGETIVDATATASGTLTLPAATDTLVGKATVDVFTNKSVDANGTGNSITNIDVADHSATGTPDATTFYRGDNSWATPAGSGDMVLAGVQTVTGLKTFDTTKLAVKGSSTGTTAVASANAGASNYTATVQAATGTIAYTSDITGTNSGTNTGDNTVATSGDSATAFFSSGGIEDAYVVDTITASSYMPLVGGTFTGEVIFDNLGVDFIESDTNPTCAAGDYLIFADLSETTLKKCLNGVLTVLDTTGGTPATADISDVSVVQTELAELETIGTTTISANQWTLLGTIAETLTSTELDYMDGVTTPTGVGALVLATSPALVTPDLGVPTAIDITAATGAFNANIDLQDGAQTVDGRLTFDGTADQLELGDGTITNTFSNDTVNAAAYEAELDNEAGLYAALSDVTNFLQTGDALAGGDITAGSVAEPELDITNAGTDNYILSYNAAGTNFTWVVDATGGTPATADISDVSVTQTELAELETLGATTISAAQWTGLGGATTAGLALWDDASAAAQLTTLGAAPLASPTFTGTVGAAIVAATGTLSGEVGVTLDTTATITLTASDTRGAFRINNDADVIDYTLPTVEAGLTVCIYSPTANIVTVDVYDGVDTITLDGTVLTAGYAVDSPGTAGDFACFLGIDATRWLILGKSGTWVDGGAD